MCVLKNLKLGAAYKDSKIVYINDLTINDLVVENKDHLPITIENSTIKNFKQKIKS
ncbi:hypothetical protein D3C85_1884280 [compost metagenome]